MHTTTVPTPVPRNQGAVYGGFMPLAFGVTCYPATARGAALGGGDVSAALSGDQALQARNTREKTFQTEDTAQAKALRPDHVWHLSGRATGQRASGGETRGASSSLSSAQAGGGKVRRPGPGAQRLWAQGGERRGGRGDRPQRDQLRPVVCGTSSDKEGSGLA